MRILNIKCEGCRHVQGRHCVAKSFTDCNLANIQSAFSQYDKVVKQQAGKTCHQVLLVSVLTQAVLDHLHMYKPNGQHNPKEAKAFIESQHAERLCEMTELNYEWFMEITQLFIRTVKRAGLRSIGIERSEANEKKRLMKQGKGE